MEIMREKDNKVLELALKKDQDRFVEMAKTRPD
jgi:hypothetical protein